MSRCVPEAADAPPTLTQPYDEPSLRLRQGLEHLLTSRHERPACPRCGGYLRSGHEPEPENPHGLCDPRHALVASCAPFAGEGAREQAPSDVNLVELVAGLMLTHDALHPGEPLYLREALSAHGVEADHVKM